MINYLKGKTVAIVGPSNTLISTGLGEEIDSHDVVVRFNKVIPLPEKYYEDFGTRTDILCNCLEGNVGTSGVIDPQLWKKNGVKYVLLPYPESVKNTTRKNQVNLIAPFYKAEFITEESFESDKVNLKAAPTTGFSCLTYLLTLDVKSISIYGMDFYRTHSYKEYYQGRKDWNQVVKDIEGHQVIEAGKELEIGHNVNTEFEYFKEHIYSNPLIRVDDNLEKLVK